MLSKYASGITAAALIGLGMVAAHSASAEVIFADNFDAGDTTSAPSVYSSAAASSTGFNYNSSTSTSGTDVPTGAPFAQFNTSGTGPSLNDGVVSLSNGAGDSGGGLTENLSGLSSTGIVETTFDFTIGSGGKNVIAGFDLGNEITTGGQISSLSVSSSTPSGLDSPDGVTFLLNATGYQINNGTNSGALTFANGPLALNTSYEFQLLDDTTTNTYTASIVGVDDDFSSGTILHAVAGDNYLMLGSHANNATYSNLSITDGVSAAPEPSQIGMLAVLAIGLGGLLLRARSRCVGSSAGC